ncbi:MAG TPA: dihydroorotate dehydrogenase [bacterium]|nr:dihydroorotate dehydrogenase [bacterium]HPP07555.1 dihydroorotate dehydrogenase [bacterium]
MKKLQIKLSKLKLDTPVLPASGTFGYGDELIDIIDYQYIGAIITKTLTWKENAGNPPPRIWEFQNGLMNSIGLQNIGVRRFYEEKLEILRNLNKTLIVSIGGKNQDDIFKSIEFLSNKKGIDALELNLSCPNIETNKTIAENPDFTFKMLKEARRLTNKVLIAKLSPNVTDICEVGLAAEQAGADILSAVNTFKGLYYDWNREKMYAGGVSGPMIFPMALRMVFELYRKVSIPIIGLGGINSGQKALEMIFSGASAVGIGTSLVIMPDLASRVCQVILDYLNKTRKNFYSVIGSRNEKKH